MNTYQLILLLKIFTIIYGLVIPPPIKNYELQKTGHKLIKKQGDYKWLCSWKFYTLKDYF